VTTCSTAILHVDKDPWRRANLITMRKGLRSMSGLHVQNDGATRRGNATTWIAAITAGLRQGADYLCVMQDDLLILPPDLWTEATPAVEKHPDDFVSLCYLWKNQVEFAERGHRWIRTVGGSWTYALIAPPALWQQLLDYHYAYTPRTRPEGSRAEPAGDDNILSHFMVHEDIAVWNTIPSLVQHIGDRKSLMGHGNAPALRRSKAPWTEPITNWHDSNPPTVRLATPTWFAGYKDPEELLKHG
jgi:hypothetical protein